MKIKKILILSLSTILLASCNNTGVINYNRDDAVKILKEYSKHDFTSMKSTTKKFNFTYNKGNDTTGQEIFDLDNNVFKTEVYVSDAIETYYSFWYFYKDGKLIEAMYNELAETGEYEEIAMSQENWDKYCSNIIDNLFNEISTIYSQFALLFSQAPTGSSETYISKGDGNISFTVSELAEIKSKNYIPTSCYLVNHNEKTTSEFKLNETTLTPPDLSKNGWKKKGEEVTINKEEFFGYYEDSLFVRSGNIYRFATTNGTYESNDESYQFDDIDLDVYYDIDGSIFLENTNVSLKCGYDNMISCETYINYLQKIVLANNGTFRFFTSGIDIGFEFSYASSVGESISGKYTFNEEGLLIAAKYNSEFEDTYKKIDLTFEDYRIPNEISAEEFYYLYGEEVQRRRGIGEFTKVDGYIYDSSYTNSLDLTIKKDENNCFFTEFTYKEKINTIYVGFSSVNSFKEYIDSIINDSDFPCSSYHFYEDRGEINFFGTYLDEYGSIKTIDVWYGEYGFATYLGKYNATEELGIYFSNYQVK